MKMTKIDLTKAADAREAEIDDCVEVEKYCEKDNQCEHPEDYQRIYTTTETETGR